MHRNVDQLSVDQGILGNTQLLLFVALRERLMIAQWAILCPMFHQEVSVVASFLPSYGYARVRVAI